VSSSRTSATCEAACSRTAYEPLAERLGLDLDNRIGNLSKGNRQKVGLTQAFMHAPELLILDEPTSGLDPVVAREFLAMVPRRGTPARRSSCRRTSSARSSSSADRAGIIRKGR
jgi:ABC-2 type transport system ATP-binding protein